MSQEAATGSRHASPPGLPPAYMPKPATSVVCPPGLEYLTTIDQVIIAQQKEIIEAISGIEFSNSYVAKNSAGQFIYNISEHSNCCARCFCGPNRCFVMDVTDYKKDAVMRFVRHLRCTQCCFCCCLQVVEVQAPPGTVIGYVRQLWSLCYPTYGIYDRQEQKVLDVVGPLCTISLPCKCGVDFEVRSTNGAVVGKITKKWGGVLKEALTDADTFGVTFPMDLDVHSKGSLMAVTMLIDYMFFESSGWS
ncbi:phospholipid scramblase 1-like isoform X2 [Dermacentor albipictus]|uniref:phospholipid scramblase 1-like isoform X2 n=1 Tax=Dermacentor albipictus TaxID=60249 RepID=UPI0031FC3BB6